MNRRGGGCRAERSVWVRRRKKKRKTKWRVSLPAAGVAGFAFREGVCGGGRGEMNESLSVFFFCEAAAAGGGGGGGGGALGRARSGRGLPSSV